MAVLPLWLRYILVVTEKDMGKREGRRKKEEQMVYDMCGSRYMAIQNKLEIHVCRIIITITKRKCRTALQGFMNTGSEIQRIGCLAL
jgi:hypothetical protein